MRFKNILKIIIFSTFIFNMFFVFGISQSFAITLPVKLFEFSSDIKTGYIDTSESPTINVGENNKAKVCRNVECDNPEIINFEISEDDPLVIDTINGLSGKVWGGELGWVVFNPPYGGVFFADTTTGLLKGTAWSETSGVINFSVTGQKVVINPTTGEWNGWAWASGPYGGWIKFDCSDPSSCVHTTWRNENDIENSPVLVVKEKDNKLSSTSVFIKQTKEIFIDVVNDFYNNFENLYNGIIQLVSIVKNQFFYSFINLYDGTSYLTSNTYNSISSSFANLYNGTKYLIVGTSDSIYTSFANLFDGTGHLIGSTSDFISSSFANLYNGTKYLIVDTSDSIYTSFANLFDKTGNLAVSVYNSVYLYSINYQASVIKAFNSIIKRY